MLWGGIRVGIEKLKEEVFVMGRRVMTIVLGCCMLSFSIVGCSQQKMEVKQEDSGVSSNMQELIKEVAETSEEVVADIQNTAKEAMETMEKTAENSQEAIAVAKTLATVADKKNYLIEQAMSLYNSEKLQDVINIAQYILQYLDKDSQAAAGLLEKAKQALTAKTQEAVGGVMGGIKDKLPGFGQ